MKRYLYILLAGAFLLSGCSKDDAAPSRTDDGAAYLNVNLGAPLTYGPAATDEERALRSVAFFIETADGAFHTYFSHADDFEEVKTDADGNITAVGLKIGGADPNGTARLAIIGNYAENGLTTTLAAVGSLQDLAAAQSNDIAANPIVSPFLVCLEPTDLTIAGGTTKSEHFVLSRLAARIDITLTFWAAGVEVDPSTLSVPPQVKLYSLKAKSYLLAAAADDVAGIAQVGMVEPALTTNARNITLTYYTYENSASDTVPLTIKVFYMGAGWRDMTLVLKDGDGKPLIKRNHYYNPVVNITPAD